MSSFLHFLLLTEGGAAAQKLIVDLEIKNKKDLTYIRVPQHRLFEVKSVLDFILNKLREQKFIVADPHYSLGSTRFAAHIMGNKINLHPNEDKQSIELARTQKKSFGDIDVDLELAENKDIEDVGKFLVKLDPTKYAYSKISPHEICTAIRINDIEVIQVDFVDVTNTRESLEYNQFSSIKDLSFGLKGSLRGALVKSTARTAPVPNISQISKIVNLSKNIEQKMMEEGSMISKATGKITGHPKIVDIRYSLGDDGLSVKVIYKKVDLEGKVLKTEKNLKLDKELDKNLPDPVPYSDLEKIAKLIGFSSAHVMHHSVEMLREIKNMPAERKQKIHQDVIDIIERMRPTETYAGGMSGDEIEKTLDFIKPYFV